MIQNNSGAGGGGGGNPGTIGNKTPTLKVDGEKIRQVTVGQPVVLTAIAADDGLPKPRRMAPTRIGAAANRGTPDSATGLRLSWFVYRGAGQVRFDPPQTKVWEDYRDGGNSPWSPGWETPPAPAGGTWISRATFSDAGTYVLRCLAHDGGLTAYEDVTFVVSR